jgi:hypothetical protein
MGVGGVVLHNVMLHGGTRDIKERHGGSADACIAVAKHCGHWPPGDGEE